eukprot:TRINITY_DN79504_c0_g1_i1.p1 TRINITY_DN79504_c0_g1~~TRINITY_DN79504_c0_g1_i1.p1  ORF type:complete len:111 (+),score=18.44 TRINITY_DN79504_c0_g1_i1:107-439(+)
MSKVEHEGWLFKKSRHVEAWRARWTVLEGTTLKTYKEEKEYKNATEEIDLTKFTNFMSLGQREKGYSFALTNTKEGDKGLSTYEFAIEDDEMYKLWKQKIEAAQAAASGH